MTNFDLDLSKYNLGWSDSDVEYAVVAGEQANAKLAAAIEAGNPPDVIRLYESNVQFYASGGHLLDVLVPRFMGVGAQPLTRPSKQQVPGALNVLGGKWSAVMPLHTFA